MPQKYLNKILKAPVYDVAIESPVDPAPGLSARLSNNVLIKREDLQPIFSFKLRGAYNKMISLPARLRKKGVIAASAGNHAQGVALAASTLKVPATIVMPQTTPEIKVTAARKRLRGQTLIAVNTEANSNFDRLLYIYERAEIGEDREALLAVTIPEKRGSFRKFCRVLGKRSVTGFNYRYTSNTNAQIFLGVKLNDGNMERTEIIKLLKKNVAR